MSNIMSYFRDMDKIAQNRVKKKNINPDSRLNQGTSWWWPPYTFSEMLEYTQGFFSAGRSSKQNPNALLGKNTATHVVGLKKAELKHNIKCDHQPESFLVAGDVLLSKNGKSIVLGSQLKEKIRNSKVMIFNVESPVTSDTEEKGRSSILNIVINGFKFSLRISESYLRALIEEIKSANPEIEIIYDIANNHTLDDTTLRYEQMDPVEKAFYNLDKSNFPVYRTIYGIRKIDPKAQIIGAWTNDLEFKAFPTPAGKINLHTEPVAKVKLNGMNCGFMALTDILNNNYTHWKTGRVMRPEDVEDILAEIKSHYKLDKLFLLIHGGVEQNLYPSEHWQNLHEQLAKHCDGIFSHGSHLPGPSQVVKNENGYVFFDPSLGNLFCPTNLQNTAVSTLLSGTVTDNSIIYFEEAIETTYQNEHPKVELISEASKKTYLGSRWNNMHQQSFFSPEIKDNPKTEYEQQIKLPNI